MIEYHKITTIFDRDPDTKYKTLLVHQYAKPEFRWLANNQWLGTEKVDGTNIRILWDGEQVRFGGKTERAQVPTHLFAVLQDTFTNLKLAGVFDHGNVCLYGEGYGAKIQSGGGYMEDGTGVSFTLFDVMIAGTWLERHNVEDIALKLSINCVPTVFSGTLIEAANMARDGFKSKYGDRPAEGLVLRPEAELFNRRGDRVITKIKTKDF